MARPVGFSRPWAAVGVGLREELQVSPGPAWSSPTIVVTLPSRSTLRTQLLPASEMYWFPWESNRFVEGALSSTPEAGPKSLLKPAMPVPAILIALGTGLSAWACAAAANVAVRNKTAACRRPEETACFHPRLLLLIICALAVEICVCLPVPGCRA